MKKSIGIEKLSINGGVTTEPVDSGSLVTWPEHGGQMVLTGNPGSLGNISWEGATHLVLDVTGLEDFTPAFVMVFTDGRKDQMPPVIFNAGAIPGVRAQISFPLAALDSNSMFIPRTPGRLKEIVLGLGVSLDKVVCIVLTTKKCHKAQKIIIHDIYLSWGEPDYTINHAPEVDRLGQSITRRWPWKTHSEEEMVSSLTSEYNKYGAKYSVDRWSKFGGDLSVKLEGTGFFRTHFDGSRWYLVDPDGYRFLSTGLDCCIPGETGVIDGIEHLFEELPDRKRFAEAYGDSGEHKRYNGECIDFSVVNLMRAFGDEWQQKWANLTKNRLIDWHFNTIGNWSDLRFIKNAQMPYVWPLDEFPTTQKRIFRDFPDVFSGEYERNSEEFAKQLIEFKNDIYLIGYFLRNEPEWAFVQNLLIAEKMLENPENSASKMKFVEELRGKYSDIAALNGAWNKNYLSFDDLYHPQAFAASFSEHAKNDIISFSKKMIRQYVAIPSKACKSVDPNHLNMGMRYSMLTNPILLEGYEYFDVFSLNGYQEDPYEEVQQAGEITGKPVIIGEFHFGAIDAGLFSAGICSVATQKDRGLAYRMYYQKGLRSPYFIGAHYFILNDQPVMGRFDGENMQIGMVDVCNKPYSEFVNEVRSVNSTVYEMAENAKDLPEPIVHRIPRLMGF